MIVRVTAASMSARGATEDIDLWFEDINDRRIGEAARRPKDRAALPALEAAMAVLDEEDGNEK
jgi:hypothetical protein